MALSGLYALSPGATELLRIAHENDRHRAIVWNAALLTAVTFAERLVRACRQGRQSLTDLFAGNELPGTFLGLVSLSLRTIQREVDELFSHPPSGPKLPVVTDYNVHALQAEAHALADIAWPKREADDFDGPPLARVVDRLSKLDTGELWRVLLQHYVANILQDVFAAARIREAVRDLDEGAEVALRSEDAKKLADYVWEQYVSRQPEEPDPRRLLRTLDQALTRAIE